MVKHLKQQLNFIKQSFSDKKILILSCLVDFIFIFGSLNLMNLYGYILTTDLKKIEGIIGTMTSIDAADLATSQLAVTGFNTLMIKGLSFFILFGIISFLFYVFGKGYIYSLLSKKNATKKYYKKFAIVSVITWALMSFIGLFVLLLLLVAQQINEYIVAFGLVISIIIFSIVIFMSLIINITFTNTPTIKSISKGFLRSFNFKIFALPILLFIIFGYLLQLTWGLLINYVFKFNDPMLLFLLSAIFLLSWFKIYIFHVYHKKYLKH